MVTAKSAINNATVIIGGLGTLGIFGLVFLMIYGNLAGNTGFAAGSKGANDTTLLVNNISEGLVTFFGYAPTLFTISAIVLFISFLLVLLYMVMGVMNKSGGKGGFSG